MKAFVTGSTGFLGSNLVELLLAERHEVLAMARTQEKGQRFLGHTDAQIVVGDMLDIPAFASNLADSDVLFHVAAYFKEYTGADVDGEKMLQKVNVEGTIELFNAAKAQGVKNIIYVSSSGVIGHSNNGQPSDETSGFHTSTPNRYFQSKIRAEQAIGKWLQQNADVRVIQILPGGILGPGDNGPTGFGRFIIDILTGSLPAIPPGSATFVDVRDVADAMIRAIGHGQSGERFIVAGHHSHFSELVPLIAKIAGTKAPSFNLPYPMAWAFGAVSEVIAKITGNTPQATRVLVQTLNSGITLSSAKAERELGARFRPIEETIDDAIKWWRAFGYL
ncbi:MAG: NAD-dependent epimerase/dehydratase family protein [Chloroflexota bacterium]